MLPIPSLQDLSNDVTFRSRERLGSDLNQAVKPLLNASNSIATQEVFIDVTFRSREWLGLDMNQAAKPFLNAPNSISMGSS